ncbi:MAG TPA: hypothetical protein DEB24_00990 [Coriobacteriia bacterium]|nr:hypothetical protein [Coriobacteriia bacterium]
MLVLGLVYAWSIFAVPLGEAYGWDPSLLPHTFSLSMASFCIGGLVCSYVSRRLSIGIALRFAATLQASGFVLVSLTASQGIWTVYVFYAVVAGIGCGIAYTTIISTVNLWFPDKVGFSSGALMMGFGLGSLTLGTASASAIEVIGLTPTFIVIGLLSFVVLSILSLLLRPAPESVELLFVKKAGGSPVTIVSGPARPMLKSPLFYLFVAWAMLTLGALLTLIGNSKQGALSLGVDPTYATLIVGFVSMMNGIARITIGLIFDRTSLKTTMTIASLVAIIAMAAIAVAFFNLNPALYYVAALLAGFAAGCMPVLSSTFVREGFGAADYTKNLSYMNFSVALASLVSSVTIAIGSLLGGDTVIYIIHTGSVISAAIIAMIFFPMYDCTKPSQKEE